jgi:uncharacterized membrane protein YtjA (UPF0391 family)
LQPIWGRQSGFYRLIGIAGTGGVSAQKRTFVPIFFRLARDFQSLAARNFCSQAGLVWQKPALIAPIVAKIETEVRVMLGWVVTFLIVALIAGILGFGGVAGASIEIAKIIFFIAVVLFVVSAVVGVARGRRV